MLLFRFCLYKISISSTQQRAVTFHSLLVTHWKSLVTRCKIRSLLVAEVARCKKSLVTRCRLCSLLVAEIVRCKKSLVTRCKFARYSLQKLLVAKVHLLLVAEVACCKNSLVTRCKIRSLLVAEFARRKNSLATRCKICLLLAANKSLVPSQHNKVKSVVGRTFSNPAIYKWAKIQQLLALNERNE